MTHPTTNPTPNGTDNDADRPTQREILQAVAGLRVRYSGWGVVWQIGIAVLAAVAGATVGAVLWAGDPDVATKTVPATDQDAVTIERIYEDGSGTFRSGSRTLSDGRVIILDGADFCLDNFGCSD